MSEQEKYQPSENIGIAVKDVVIPPDFIVSSETSEGQVACGIAVTNSDLIKRRLIVAERYEKANYIRHEEVRPNGEYYDEYEDISVPIVAKINNEVAASMRIIPNLPSIGVPVNNEPNITVYPEWENKIAQIPFEISQLAKSMNYYRDPRPTFALIRTYFAYSRMVGENDAAGVVDNRVKNVLNGKYMSFGLPDIGPSVSFMGSDSTPIYINIDDVINNTAKAGHTNLAKFLDSGKADGFEWYKGM